MSKLKYGFLAAAATTAALFAGSAAHADTILFDPTGLGGSLAGGNNYEDYLLNNAGTDNGFGTDRVIPVDVFNWQTRNVNSTLNDSTWSIFINNAGVGSTSAITAGDTFDEKFQFFLESTTCDVGCLSTTERAFMTDVSGTVDGDGSGADDDLLVATNTFFYMVMTASGVVNQAFPGNISGSALANGQILDLSYQTGEFEMFFDAGGSADGLDGVSVATWSIDFGSGTLTEQNQSSPSGDGRGQLIWQATLSSILPGIMAKENGTDLVNLIGSAFKITSSDVTVVVPNPLTLACADDNSETSLQGNVADCVLVLDGQRSSALTIVEVPEPGIVGTLGAGLVALGAAFGWRRKYGDVA